MLIFYETYESTQHQWALTLNPLNQAKKLEISHTTNPIEHLARALKYGKTIIDMGAPLGRSACFDKKGSSKGKTEVTGYSIIEAKDMDGVKSIVANHPHLMMSTLPPKAKHSKK